MFKDPAELSDALKEPLAKGDLGRARELMARALSLWRPMDLAGAWAVLDGRAEISDPLAAGGDPLVLANALAELAASPQCLGCGCCCRTSSPTLYAEDRDLIAPNGLRLQDLFTLRAGELAYSARLKRLEPLGAELIKLRERGGACLHLAGSRCGVYRSRPLQCRQLECWSNSHAGQLSGRPRLDRRDLFGHDQTALALLAEYDGKLPAGQVMEGFRLAAQGDDKACALALGMLEMDHRLRSGIAARYGYGPDVQPVLLGRPLKDMLAAFGLALGLDQNDRPTLSQKGGGGK